MSHYEGQIVNSFYDCFLISWWSHPFTPPLPCLKDRVLADDNRNKSNFQFGDDSPTTKFIKNQTLYAVARARQILQNHTNLDETEFIYEHDKLENVSKAEKAKEFHKVVEQVMRVHKALQQEKESPLTQHFNSVSKYPCAMSSEISSPDLELLAIDFCPFIFHQPHEPFPIALVNRLPSGTPGHESKQVPQNAAWLGAFKYAQRNIFIQSPTLNASSAIKAILEACRRGIKVELYLDLGFNDLAEGYFPFQGGTNEHVVRSLFKELKKDRKDDVVNNLAVYWYVGKGM
ncbi:unnamed protein product [Didymodactylos carnosus]|uniref:Uncharacterized protein n=1 Tax=Didymodactylos carnosus TaxID=1234261 RepID=A0A816CPX6_9BILA|nr:unnamed protein product [Didymodactylos carnosus]CAF4517652.1 unnamed protein product [Didymodactylos carnosus]